MSELLLPLMPAMPTPVPAIATPGVRPSSDGTPDLSAAPEPFASHIERALRTSLAAPFVAAPAALMKMPLPPDAVVSDEAVAFANEGDAESTRAEDHDRGLDAIRALVASVADSAQNVGDSPDANRTTIVPNPAPVPMRPGERTATREERRPPVSNDPTIVRDIEALDPELRVRVERVIGRMDREFGHDVRLAETWRSQSRQNDLYAQGRTRGGELVTWTRHSRHTEGLAADFVVDGNWDNPIAYERLQRIAREEGLRTLGAKDAGHVEIAATDARGMDAGAAMPAEHGAADRALETALVDERSPFGPARRGEPRLPERTTAPGIVRPVIEPARAAAVASIASIEQPVVAHVAAVATVASPMVYASAPRKEASAAAEDDREGSAIENPSQTEPPPFIDSRAQQRPAHTSVGETEAVRANTGLRAEHIEALRDLVRAQPVSGLVLRVDSAGGIDDRIRIDVRGTRVDASIGVNNEIRANDLARRIPELTRALEARGFESGATQILPTNAGVRMHETPGAASQVAERLAIDALTGAANPRHEPQSGSNDEPPPRSQHHPSRERARRERQGDHP